MTKPLRGRVEELESRTSDKRIILVWRDDYQNPTRYLTRDGEISKSELETLEADPGVKVIRFVWRDSDDQNYKKQN